MMGKTAKISHGSYHLYYTRSSDSALFGPTKTALIEGVLFQISSKSALSEDLGSFSMSTNPRIALIEGALSKDLEYLNLW